MLATAATRYPADVRVSCVQTGENEEDGHAVYEEL